MPRRRSNRCLASPNWPSAEDHQVDRRWSGRRQRDRYCHHRRHRRRGRDGHQGRGRAGPARTCSRSCRCVDRISCAGPRPAVVGLTGQAVDMAAPVRGPRRHRPAGRRPGSVRDPPDPAGAPRRRGADDAGHARFRGAARAAQRAVARPDPAGDLVLRSVLEPWPLPPQQRDAPELVAAVDLADGPAQSWSSLAAFCGLNPFGQRRSRRRLSVRPLIPTAPVSDERLLGHALLEGVPRVRAAGACHTRRRVR